MKVGVEFVDRPADFRAFLCSSLSVLGNPWQGKSTGAVVPNLLRALVTRVEKERCRWYAQNQLARLEL